MGTKLSARPRLQREVVVERAMAMADSEGLEAVTIRRLAQDLGVTPMALYWHFADKDALLAAVSEELWRDTAARLDRPADPAGPGEDPWRELRSITAAVVDALRAHPGCATLAPLGVLSCEAGLDLTERALELFEEAGIAPRDAPEMAHLLLSTAITLVATRPGGGVCLPDHEAKMRAKKVALASLPPDRYPRIAATADSFVDCDDLDAYFERGVDFVLGGVRQRVPAPPTREAPPTRKTPSRAKR